MNVSTENASFKATCWSTVRRAIGSDGVAARAAMAILCEGYWLNVPIGTLENHVFRMRERWRALLMEQVTATLDDPTPAEIRAELSELIGCV